VNALSARAGIVGEHSAERNSKSLVTGLALRQAPHAGDGTGFAIASGVERLVIRHCHIVIWRIVSVELPINVNGFLSSSLPR
jgi:hypothetical protein